MPLNGVLSRVCRLLSIIGSEDEVLDKEWISAWIGASINDPLLKKVLPQISEDKCRHDDGWGIAVAFHDVQQLELLDTRYVRSIRPVDPSIQSLLKLLTLSTRKSEQKWNSQRALVLHSRKASPNTPISVIQNQPIPVHFPTQQKTIFLSHNGSVDREVVNELLSFPHQLQNQKEMERYSDTEMLSWLIGEWYQKHQDQIQDHLWLSFFRHLIDKHEEREKSFAMMIHLLEISSTNINFILISAVSEDNLHKMEYYQQYHVSFETVNVFCSSTVYDRFKSGESSRTYSIESEARINNNSVLIWSSKRQSLVKCNL